MNLLLLSKFLNLVVHWPSKMWPVGIIARKICSKIEKSLVFHDNRNLTISKSKKSEQYFRDKFEIFIRLFL